MKFQMPESLDGLSLEELGELHAAAFEEYAEIAMKDDAEISDADLASLEELNKHIEGLDAATAALESAAQERADKLAAARGKVAEATAPAEETPDAPSAEDDEDPEDEGDPPAAEDADEPEDAEAEQEKVLVTASAARRTVVRKAASKAPRPEEVIPETGGAVLVAAANLPEVAAGAAFSDMRQASEVWRQRVGKSPAAAPRNDLGDIRPVQTLSQNHTRLGFMKIQKGESEFTIDNAMSVQEQLEVIDKAADERKRFGRDGVRERALTAAGGWCAPSETVYDFCSFETVSGILDVPTVTIRRGGINFTKGPDYATLAADWGFLQTEAQAEAGTEKECYAVECPDFTDHRMDVVGFCVTAGVLTASPAGYPELIQRVLEIGTVAHAHKINADTISRVSTLIGAAVDHAEIGVTTNDVLDAVMLQATRIRYSLAMDPNATIEGVAPLWLRDVMKADLGRRTGVDFLSVSDQQLTSYLAARGVRLQFVYDYQPFASANTAAWTSYPDTVEIMLYPAGAFVRGTSNVIDLDTIYDSVGLSTNTYTAAFFEEGQMVFNRCGFGVKVSIDVSCLAGRSGAADVTCVTP